jgi:hypothetical protein
LAQKPYGAQKALGRYPYTSGEWVKEEIGRCNNWITFLTNQPGIKGDNPLRPVFIQGSDPQKGGSAIEDAFLKAANSLVDPNRRDKDTLPWEPGKVPVFPPQLRPPEPKRPPFMV